MIEHLKEEKKRKEELKKKNATHIPSSNNTETFSTDGQTDSIYIWRICISETDSVESATHTTDNTAALNGTVNG